MDFVTLRQKILAIVGVTTEVLTVQGGMHTLHGVLPDNVIFYTLSYALI